MSGASFLGWRGNKPSTLCVDLTDGTFAGRMTQRDIKMTSNLNKALILVAVSTLTACGAGGGGDDGGVAQPALFFGSTEGAVARSGLDFADGSQNKADLEGQQHTVRVTRTITNTATGEVEKRITDEVITLGAAEADGFVDDFTITLDGETLEFVGSITERADGTSIIGFERDDVTGFRTDFVRGINLLATPGFGGRDDETTTAFFVTGFETAPDVVAALGGTTIYSGGIFGAMNSDERTDAFEGSVTLNASFDDGMIDGSFNLTSFGTQFGQGTVDLALAPTAVTGNGFAGDLTVTDCSFDSCTSASSVGGAFFGPNAEEVGGIIDIDITATQGGVDDQVRGDGVFLGVESP